LLFPNTTVLTDAIKNGTVHYRFVTLMSVYETLKLKHRKTL